MNDQLEIHRQTVNSVPATPFAMVEWRDGGLVLRHVLGGKRSG